MPIPSRSDGWACCWCLEHAQGGPVGMAPNYLHNVATRRTPLLHCGSPRSSRGCPVRLNILKTCFGSFVQYTPGCFCFSRASAPERMTSNSVPHSGQRNLAPFGCNSKSLTNPSCELSKFMVCSTSVSSYLRPLSGVSSRKRICRTSSGVSFRFICQTCSRRIAPNSRSRLLPVANEARPRRISSASEK